MKIRRTGAKWEGPGSMEPKDIAHMWNFRWRFGREVIATGHEPGSVTLGGMDIGITEDDVIALYAALIERYKEWRKWAHEREQAKDKLQEAIRKIEKLSSSVLETPEAGHTEDAKLTSDECLCAIKIIASHFAYGNSTVILKNKEPKIPGMKYKSI